MKTYYYKHQTGVQIECCVLAAENNAQQHLLLSLGFERISVTRLRKHFRQMNRQIMISGRSRALSPYRFCEVSTMTEALRWRMNIQGLDANLDTLRFKSPAIRENL